MNGGSYELSSEVLMRLPEGSGTCVSRKHSQPLNDQNVDVDQTNDWEGVRTRPGRV